MSPGRGILVVVLAVAAGPARAQLLTTALEVRSLSFPAAEQAQPARLRGTVVFIEPAAVFVQDETSTTFFRPKRLGALRPGDEIEVEGRTRMGLYLPGLGEADYRVLDHRSLPAGIPATYDDLASARHHYQRVTVTGIVRSVRPVEEGRSLVRLAMGSRVLEVRVEMPPEPARTLVDSRVRVTGLAAGFINERRQLVQPYVRVIGWDDVSVLQAAPAPEQIPGVSAAGLLGFRVAGQFEHRVRIEGVVTATFGPDRLFLRQDTVAFAVRLAGPVACAIGDRVAVVGFAEMERFSASVVDAEVLARAAGPAPKPVEIDSPDRLGGAHDADLVALTAVIRDAFRSGGGMDVLLQSGARTIQARLPDGVAPPEPGSRLRVVGVCRVEAQGGRGFSSRAGVVSLRARTPADVVVLERPSWWTTRRLAGFVGALAGLTVLAGIWITVLRRQVNRQTRALRRRIETEAILEERQRIAREFHDSLEQELAGLSLRLDALATRALDEKGQTLIATSRHLVSRIQTETRNLISDLRDSSESAGDLTAALAGVATRVAADSGVDVRLEPAARLPFLPAGTVHDLRMIARESVQNALKHGRATQISIEVAPREDRLVMRVVDNGTGFDVTAARNPPRGHFGCAGIRERSRKMQGDVVWHTAHGGGTTVEVTLPVPPPAKVNGGGQAARTAAR